MLSAEQLKRKITSTQEFQTIVKTMKTMAAVNIHQYEQAVVALQEYAQTLRLGTQILLIHYPELLEDFSRPDRPRSSHQRVGVIAFGSDQGMCGRFNEQLASYVRDAIAAVVSPLDVLVLAMGARMETALQEQGFAIERCFMVPASIDGITAKVQAVVVQIEQWRREHQVDRILLFHNCPGSGNRYVPRQQQLFPLDIERLRRLQQEPWGARCRPQVFLPREQLFSALFRQYFFVILYQACAESLSSENMSRLTSMQIAQRNVTDHLQALQSTFQQQRQTMITEELLDIMSGFEALNVSD